jgi:hypothetical protein
MLNEWSLREEILAVTHRWPIIIFYCLLGSLIGWGIALSWPSTYRATKELYVGLNIYRTQQDHAVAQDAGVEFYNGDDYKNWQMADLNSLIFMDSITNEALNRLRSMDNYWSSVSREELTSMLHVYWRNAGKWRLVAESDDPQHAAQAVSVWEEVVVEIVHSAVQEAQNTMLLDLQLQSITNSQTQIISRTIELKQMRDFLQTWSTETSQLPEDQPLTETDRWSIWSTLANANLSSLAWKSLLDAFPSSERPLSSYLSWLDQANLILDQEGQALTSQAEALGSEKNRIAAQYAEASKKSLGLSTNLEVDKISDDPPQQTVVRPTSLLILIGGSLGLIVWAAVWLAWITLRARK